MGIWVFGVTLFVIGYLLGRSLTQMKVDVETTSKFQPYRVGDKGEKVVGIRTTGSDGNGRGKQAFLILDSGREILVAE